MKRTIMSLAMLLAFVIASTSAYGYTRITDIMGHPPAQTGATIKCGENMSLICKRIKEELPGPPLEGEMLKSGDGIDIWIPSDVSNPNIGIGYFGIKLLNDFNYANPSENVYELNTQNSTTTNYNVLMNNATAIKLMGGE